MEIEGGSIDASIFNIGSLKQWNLWYLQTFDGENNLQESGFTGGEIYECNKRKVLKSGTCDKTAISKKFVNVPRHSSVKVTAIVDLLDRWKGEHLSIYLNGNII